MNSNEKQQFLDWLEEIKFMLPPKMKVNEAREIWDRKVREEGEIDERRVLNDNQ